LSEWEALEIMDVEQRAPAPPSPPSRALVRPRPTPEQLVRQIERCFPITAERGGG
jgi:hypothetical protein